MKGIARTQKEIEFHDRVAALGCISCRQEGIHNTWVSIHHAHGRTKPGCHMWVLPLCEPHHQDNGTAIARHPYKRRWEAKYGNEDDLIRAMWTELGVEFTEPVRVSKPVDKSRAKKPNCEAVEVGVVKLKDLKQQEEKSAKEKSSSLTVDISKVGSCKPKAKIKSRGFNKSIKLKIPSKSKISTANKQQKSEREMACIAERKAASKAFRLKLRNERMTKIQSAS